MPLYKISHTIYKINWNRWPSPRDWRGWLFLLAPLSALQ